MTAPLNIRLLGDFSILAGEGPAIQVDTPRHQSILAFLLLHRDAPQPRQRLAFLLWPDTTDAQAQTNLRQLMHRLRAALPQLSDSILTEGRTLQWNAATQFTLDVMKFGCLLTEATQSESGLVRLSEAVELYRGDLLPGLYDEWVIAEREQLREKYTGALEALAKGLLDRGKHSEARLYAERLKGADALRESAYRTLMEACAGMGDYSGAVHAYQECAALLEQEIGVQPSPATQSTYRRILELAAAQQGTATLPAVARAKTRTPTNLPASPNSFIGRHAEIAAVNALLGQDPVRLLTLVGAPGVGKTRLALEVAASRSGSFLDGVYIVPLAPVSDPSLVASTIAHTLGVREQVNQPLEDTLASWLRDKRLLLLLDNFEHLLDAAIVVSGLLSSCANLKVLVTSREALQLYGEQKFPVPPLELPGLEESATMEPSRLAEYSAIRLFKERASAGQFGFTLDAKNTAVVAAICRKLDALPLAIELAASRVKLMPPDILLQRLEQRFNELKTVVRNLPARHKTLLAAIEWSYDLLQPQEQMLFRSLGVFVGGCTLDAVQDVVAGIADVETVLYSLLDKSLLYSVVDANGVPRYSMLETIREYAREKLKESGQEEMAEREHALYFMELAEEAQQHLTGPKQHDWLDRLEVELDNFRAALRWANRVSKGESRVETLVGDIGEREALVARSDTRQAGEKAEAAMRAAEIGLRIAGALPQLWMERGYQSEDKEQLAQILASARILAVTASVSSEHETRPGKSWRLHFAKALTTAGRMAIIQDDYPSARSLIEQSLVISQEEADEKAIGDLTYYLAFTAQVIGDYTLARSLYERSLVVSRQLDHIHGITNALKGMGYIALVQEDYFAAHSLFMEGLVVAQEAGDKRAWAWSLYWLGVVAQLSGDYPAAAMRYRESITLAREISSTPVLTQTLSNLASVECSQGNYATARSLYREGLILQQQYSNKYGIAVCLAGSGTLAVQMPSPDRMSLISEAEQRSRGVALLGATEALIEAISTPFVLDERRVYEQGVVLGRELLGEATFARAWAEGRGLDVEEAIALALTLL
jgi:predicted ATPase/DNA-binding SARP family transcriptional activator